MAVEFHGCGKELIYREHCFFETPPDECGRCNRDGDVFELYHYGDGIYRFRTTPYGALMYDEVLRFKYHYQAIRHVIQMIDAYVNRLNAQGFTARVAE